MSGDPFGPGDAGAPRALTTTTDVSAPIGGDTFFGDCGGVIGQGTPFVAKWVNRLIDNLRQVVRAPGGVGLDNSDGTMLVTAIRRLIQADLPNWAGTFGGTAAALTATLSPVPSGLAAGLVVRGIAPLAATGAATLTLLDAGGAIIATRPITWPDGTAIAAGDWGAGEILQFLDDGTACRLVSPESPTQIRALAQAANMSGGFTNVQQPWFYAQTASQVPSTAVGPLSSWSLIGSALGDATFSLSNGDFTVGTNTRGVWSFTLSTSPTFTVTSAATASIYSTTAGVKTPLGSTTVDVNSSGGFAPHVTASAPNKFVNAGEKILFAYAQRVNTTNVIASAFGIRVAN